MRRIFLALVLVFAAAVSLAGDYPARNISLLVPYGAGGNTDLAARATVDSLPSGTLPSGVAFTITNMPGAGGLTGATFVANARKDGYTVCALTGDFIYASVRGATDMPVDTFIPLIWMQVDPYLIIVKADAPYKTLKEFVDYIKANPGQVRFGDSGRNAVTYLVGHAMQQALNLDIRTISYDSSLEAITAIVGGEVHATVTHSVAASGQLRAGEVIPIAVSSTGRSPIFPSIPSIAEIFPVEAKDINIVSTMGLAVHKDTPPEIVEYLRKVFTAAVGTDVYKEKMKAFQSQDISSWTVTDTVGLYDQLASYYKILAGN
ncbi:MAG: tripartite tricarboxylate transporter substrate binding protein [Planctomycetes bacterium]|nr:tripartite tricarboxylate transporter substrate binding protein [Planctomycetota bacterium]